MEILKVHTMLVLGAFISLQCSWICVGFLTQAWKNSQLKLEIYELRIWLAKNTDFHALMQIESMGHYHFPIRCSLWIYYAQFAAWCAKWILQRRLRVLEIKHSRGQCLSYPLLWSYPLAYFPLILMKGKATPCSPAFDSSGCHWQFLVNHNCITFKDKIGETFTHKQACLIVHKNPKLDGHVQEWTRKLISQNN